MADFDISLTKAGYVTIKTPAGRIVDIYNNGTRFEITVRTPDEGLNDGGLIYEEFYTPEGKKDVLSGRPFDSYWSLGRKEQLENL